MVNLSQNPALQTNIGLSQNPAYTQCVTDFNAETKKDGNLWFWLILGGLLSSWFFGVGGIVALVGIFMIGRALHQTGKYIFYLLLPLIMVIIGLVMIFVIDDPMIFLVAMILAIAGGITSFVVMIKFIMVAADLKNGSNSEKYIQIKCSKFQ